LNQRFRRKTSPASPCPNFAARHFAQTPLAFSLPQDSSRELMFDPCAKHNSGASASLHSNLSALREARIDNARRRTSYNSLMRRSNPSRADRRSMPVGLKPFDLLNFSTATTRQKPAQRRRSPQFGRNAPEVCRKTRRVRQLSRRLKCDAR
jgi:hypothetical protein